MWSSSRVEKTRRICSSHGGYSSDPKLQWSRAIQRMSRDSHDRCEEFAYLIYSTLRSDFSFNCLSRNAFTSPGSSSTKLARVAVRALQR